MLKQLALTLAFVGLSTSALAQVSEPMSPGFYSWQDPVTRLMESGQMEKLDLNWSPHIEAQLKHLLAQDLSGQVAVFDADQTLWRNDVGEAFLQWLIREGKLPQGTSQVPQGRDVYAHYEALCAQDKNVGYPYAAQVMAGLSESDVRRLAAHFFADHFRKNIYPAQQLLIEKLHKAGAEVWIVSASNQWIIEAAANYLGVPAARVVGIRLAVKSGLVSDEILQPVTYRAGKVAAIKKYIGKQPILVAGDSMTDYEMLQYAKSLRLVINPRDQGPDANNIYRLSQQHGWLIQMW